MHVCFVQARAAIVVRSVCLTPDKSAYLKQCDSGHVSAELLSLGAKRPARARYASFSSGTTVRGFTPRFSCLQHVSKQPGPVNTSPGSDR